MHRDAHLKSAKGKTLSSAGAGLASLLLLTGCVEANDRLHKEIAMRRVLLVVGLLTLPLMRGSDFRGNGGGNGAVTAAATVVATATATATATGRASKGGRDG